MASAMDKLIPVINKLHDVFNTVGYSQIDLPTIAVVGSQSSGKSSVLEAVVGRDFLPRGAGIVTRRPLVLQLVNSNNLVQGKGQEWGEFLHSGAKKYTSYNDIKLEIEAETERETGTNKGISNKPINLRIFSPTVVDLTLVDLPGLTKVAVGDQDQDISEKIRSMVLEFVTKSNCIILAVTAANVDLANSDALQLAKEVDPEGGRTLGVLTKLDLMDKGTDCLDALLGRVYKLKRGFVGVVNRSQEDINNKKDMKSAMKMESEFFQKHPSYSSLASRMGTAYLASTLSQMLMLHIQECLPAVKRNIQTMMEEVQEELNAYGDCAEDTESLVIEAVLNYCDAFNALLTGSSKNMSLEELQGGARINYIFKDVFGGVLNSIDPCGSADVNDMLVALRNTGGTRPSLFVSESAFEAVVKRQIAKLEQPALQCAQMTYTELVRISQQAECLELSRYPALHQKVLQVAKLTFDTYLDPTCKLVTALVKKELAYINNDHPDFMAGSNMTNLLADQLDRSRKQQQQAQQAQQQAAAKKAKDEEGFFGLFKSKPPPAKPAQASPSAATGEAPANTGINLAKLPEHINAHLASGESDSSKVAIIQILLTAYFNIVRKNIADTVPKAVMYGLVNKVKAALQQDLLKALLHSADASALTLEDPEITNGRKRSREILALLGNAQKLIDEVSVGAL